MRHALLTGAKSAAAGVLTVLSYGLQAAAEAVQAGAQRMRPPAEAPSASLESAASSEPGAARSTAIVAELVDRPARDVTAELDRLSVDDLRRLREREEATKRRKTVLDAIDRTLADRP